jgi:hypothetical protein
MHIKWNLSKINYFYDIISEYVTSLEKFQNRISQHEMYPEDDWLVQRVLHNLAVSEFRDLCELDIEYSWIFFYFWQHFEILDEKSGGTQFKMIVKYENGYRALFKPMRFARDQQAAVNQHYYNDYERHNGEIASYHLDK